MRPALALAILLPLLASACTDWRSSAFTTAKNLECQHNGGSTTACAKSYSDDYRAMKREESQNKQKSSNE